MPFIEAGDRSYLCAGKLAVKTFGGLFSSFCSTDPITVKDAWEMYRRHHNMSVQSDKLGEFQTNTTD